MKLKTQQKSKAARGQKAPKVISDDEFKQALAQRKNNNHALAIEKNKRLQYSLIALASVSFLFLGTYIYSRSQVKVNREEDDADQPNEYLKQKEQIELQTTNNQLFYLTLGFFGLICLLKKYFDHQEKDHQESSFVMQITAEEFERQRSQEERNKIDQQILQSAEYKDYLRKKKRFEQLDAELPPEEGQEEQDLNNLLHNSDDEFYMEQQFSDIRDRIKQIKDHMEATPSVRDDVSVSRMSSTSLPIQKGSSSVFTSSQIPQEFQPQRRSMQPSLTQKLSSQKDEFEVPDTRSLLSKSKQRKQD